MAQWKAQAKAVLGLKDEDIGTVQGKKCDYKGKAITIAQRYKPLSVTPHWFTPATSDSNNMMLATRLRTSLIGTKGLSSSRIDTEVNSGRVVLLGVVKDDAEKQLAVKSARGVAGVTSVTSYLMLPQKVGQLGTSTPEQHDGAGLAGEGMGAGSGSGGMNTTPASSPARSGGGSSGGDLESNDLPCRKR